MPAPLLIDLTHTSHSAARSGVQRVTRGLWEALKGGGVAITYDPWAGAWRSLERWEREALESPPPPGARRGAQWPFPARLRGWLRRVRTADGAAAVPASWSDAAGLIVPEIFSARVAGALPALLSRVRGPRVALFHDAIALRYPELSAPRTVARFPAYLADLARFDGIAAVSAAARDELLTYWEWSGIERPPPVIALPLGVNSPPPRQPAGAAPPADDQTAPEILCVASLEGRKNHLALLDACETLWQEGLAFRLRLIGHPQKETGGAALARISQLITRGRPLVYQGSADDAVLESAYSRAAFTVYPSLFEGFGLPVAESVLRGKPAICSSRGALGEIAALGGCLTVDPPDAAGLASACRRLLLDLDERERLAVAARRVGVVQAIATPARHAAALVSWMQTLRREDLPIGLQRR